ncbi:MAG: hypothetical protein AAF579_19380 [Cyanobacteria bacterium P01_C01_bin.118]
MSIFQLKQSLIDPVDLHGVIKIQLGPQDNAWITTYLTRLDQALMAWGVITAIIFVIAQSYLIDWPTQAILWSVLSCAAIVISGQLTWFWVTTRHQRWIFYSWSVLVLVGLGITDYGIFTGVGVILRYLCPLWLSLSTLGYIITGIGIQAQALMLIGLIHGFAIPTLMLVPYSQFLLTGGVMSVSLFLLAIFHWDHH